MKRSRVLYCIFIVITMILGLLSRKISYLPYVIKAYSGDVLWALMIFFIVAFIFNEKKSVIVSIIALGFSYVIEFSQLYHSQWIDSIRSTILGGLILGFGFLWSDILCYTIGVLSGICIEKLIIKKSSVL